MQEIMMSFRIKQNTKIALENQAFNQGLSTSQYCRNILEIFSKKVETEREDLLEKHVELTEAVSTLSQAVTAAKVYIKSFDFYGESTHFMESVLSEIRKAGVKNVW